MKLKSTFLATTALLAAGNAAADVTVYGQVNKLLVGSDNGVNSSTEIVDNDMSSTRFGFKAQQQLNSGLTVSGLLEIQSESNTSRNIDATGNEENEKGSSITERHARVGLAGKFGAIFLGKTSDAADGISELDLGGVKDVMGSDIPGIGGAIQFKRKDGSPITGNPTISDLYSNQDGGRTNVVRYDSPIASGFQGSVSVASGGDSAIAARYTGKVAAFKVKAGLAYQKFGSAEEAAASDRKNATTGSVTALHEPTGVAATVALGKGNNKDETAQEFMYTKLSFMPQQSAFEYAVELAGAKDKKTAEKGRFSSMGLGVQYNIAKGVSSSVMFRNMDAKYNGSKTDDVKIMTAGLKVKF